MTSKEIARKIMQAEINWYKHFANYENTDYGIVFYNTDDPTWTDYNHAHILKYNKNSDFDAIITEIKNFYVKKDLRPMIYSAFERGQLEKIKDSLIKNGFTIEENYGGQTFLIHTSECKINVPYTLNFKRINNGEDLSFIYEVMPQDWKEDVDDIIERRIKFPNYRLFAGYLDDVPVVIADMEYFKGVVLIDDVGTSEKHRGKGYAREIIRFLVDYHYKNYKGSLLYLYYDNPVAGRIYRDAGFTEADIESWAAYIE